MQSARHLQEEELDSLLGGKQLIWGLIPTHPHLSVARSNLTLPGAVMPWKGLTQEYLAKTGLGAAVYPEI